MSKKQKTNPKSPAASAHNPLSRSDQKAGPLLSPAKNDDETLGFLSPISDLRSFIYESAFGLDQFFPDLYEVTTWATPITPADLAPTGNLPPLANPGSAIPKTTQFPLYTQGNPFDLFGNTRQVALVTSRGLGMPADQQTAIYPLTFGTVKSAL
jgi:hypothetical protein